MTRTFKRIMTWLFGTFAFVALAVGVVFTAPQTTVAKAADTASKFLVVELNMGQMVDDVKVAIDCRRPVSFFGRTGGMLPTADDVLEEIKKLNGGKQ